MHASAASLGSTTTEFEREVDRLGLHTNNEMIFSHTLRDWVKKHRNFKFVPEFLLSAYDMEVNEGYSPTEERGHFGRSVHSKSKIG